MYRSSTLPDPPALLPMMRILKPFELPLFANWFGATAAGRAVVRITLVVVAPAPSVPRGPCDGIITAPAPAPNVPVNAGEANWNQSSSSTSYAHNVVAFTSMYMDAPRSLVFRGPATSAVPAADAAGPLAIGRHSGRSMRGLKA